MNETGIKKQTIDVNIKMIIHFIVMCALMFGFKYLPTIGSVTEYGMAVLGVFIGCIYGWTVAGIFWPTLLAMFGLVAAGYGTIDNVAMAMLNNSTVFTMMAGCLCFMVLMQSKVADWALAKILSSNLAQKSPLYTVMMLLLATVLINCFGGQWIFLFGIFPIMIEMLKKCGYQKTDRMVVFFLVAYMSAIQMGMCFRPFVGWGIMTAGTMQKLTGTAISYGAWMLIMIVLYVAFITLYPLFMKLCGCDFSKLQDVDVVKTFNVDPNAKLKLNQKIVLIAMGAFLAVVIFFGIFGKYLPSINAYYSLVSVSGCMLIFWIAMMVIKIEGKPLLDMKEAATMFSWDMFFLIAFALLISSVLTSADTGISAWITSILSPIFANKSQVFLLVVLGVATMVASNFANNIAVCYIMMNLMASLYLNGIHFSVLAASLIISNMSVIAFLTPASSLGGAMIHGQELGHAPTIYKWMWMPLLFLLVLMLLVFVTGGILLG